MGGMSSQVIWKQSWNEEAESTLRQALASNGCALRELSSQLWDPRTATIGGVRDYETSYVAPASSTWSSVLLRHNSLVAENLAAELSRFAGCSIAFFEYDEATWGYCLFENGQLQDRFWSAPEAVDMATADCKGNVDKVANLFEVSQDLVASYIRHINDAEYDTKVYEDDEFTLGNHWVRCDFMRRLGLTYPNPGQVEGGRHILIVEYGDEGVSTLHSREATILNLPLKDFSGKKRTPVGKKP